AMSALCTGIKQQPILSRSYPLHDRPCLHLFDTRTQIGHAAIEAGHPRVTSLGDIDSGHLNNAFTLFCLALLFGFISDVLSIQGLPPASTLPVSRDTGAQNPRDTVP